MTKEIIVTKKNDDYHACLKDHPEIWGCGNIPKAAIGDLIATHTAAFDIEVAHDYSRQNNAYLKMQGVEIIEGRK